MLVHPTCPIIGTIRTTHTPILTGTNITILISLQATRPMESERAAEVLRSRVFDVGMVVFRRIRSPLFCVSQIFFSFFSVVKQHRKPLRENIL
ncbi:MAG: hypothetical protein EA424_16420 [Planctomycetaceae bacterium]|nr:MAG: hypothetical protein EA424_16420 [Planctomycetaceae bacterium]